MLQGTLECRYLYELWLSPDKYPEVGLLDHMVALYFVFKGTSILFSIVAAPINITSSGMSQMSINIHVQLLCGQKSPTLLGTTAGLHSNRIFSFVRNDPTAFTSGCQFALITHKQWINLLWFQILVSIGCYQGFALWPL